MLPFQWFLRIFVLIIFGVSKKLCNQTSEANDIPTTSAEEIVPDESKLRAICPYFKNSGHINLDGMVGVWRPVYYQVSYKVPCFDMLIRKVTSKEKYIYSQRYGDFNEKVIWEDCNLEIKLCHVSRKHFLQGCHKGFGILENIVIDQKDNSTPSLSDENADQWLVLENLLLLKDCVSREIVMFSKDSYQPKLNEVKEAVEKFGGISDGEWACKDVKKTEGFQAFDGEFESDSDVIFFE